MIQANRSFCRIFLFCCCSFLPFQLQFNSTCKTFLHLVAGSARNSGSELRTITTLRCRCGSVGRNPSQSLGGHDSVQPLFPAVHATADPAAITATIVTLSTPKTLHLVLTATHLLADGVSQVIGEFIQPKFQEFI